LFGPGSLAGRLLPVAVKEVHQMKTVAIVAQVLVLLWGVFIFLFWLKTSNDLGQQLADIPSGLAAVIVAVVALTGWKIYVTRKYPE
jgi:chromate transport protein ChrA